MSDDCSVFVCARIWVLDLSLISLAITESAQFRNGLARAMTLAFAVALVVLGAGCREKAAGPDAGPPTASAAVATTSTAASTAAPTAAPSVTPKAATHEGGSIARTPRGDALIIAD